MAWPRRIGLDLLAQVGDVRIDHPIRHVRGRPQISSSNWLRVSTWPRRRMKSDSSLNSSVVNSTSRPARRTWHAANSTSMSPNRIRLRQIAARSAQDRLEPCPKLARAERLGDVVVGAKLEAEDLVRLLRLGGQQDDRRPLPCPADVAADLESVAAGQHDVQDDGVKRLLDGEAAGCGPSRATTTR